MLRYWICTLFLVFGPAAYCDQSVMPPQQSPYIYCNVYATDSCFGIAGGDTLRMRIISDYVLYDVVFAGGGTASIYSGFNPQALQAEKEIFASCSWPNNFGDCKMRKLKLGYELLARRDPAAAYIHVILHARTGLAFLKNIRACTEQDSKISCPTSGVK